MPARAVAVRAVARYAAPLLESCGVQPADEATQESMQISRPTAHEMRENKPAPETQKVGDQAEAEEEAAPETVRVLVSVARATGLPKADFMGTADPYVELRVLPGDPLNSGTFRPKEVQKGHNSKEIDAKSIFKATTKTIRGTLDPVWDESFVFEVPCESAGKIFLYFRVYDYDVVTSHDFLGHVSIGLMETLVAGKDLSSGWKALLRSSPSVPERIEILRDDRLTVRKIPPCRLQAVPGQEAKYDLRKSELFIDVELPDRLENPLAAKQNLRGGRASFGLNTSLPNPEQREALNRDVLRAASNGEVPLVRSALLAGAAVNASAANGQWSGCAPLHIACLKGFDDLAKALVDVFDASLVQRAPGGRSAAMCACEGGDESLAEWLVNEGVPVDLRDDAGRTVLFYAAKAALPGFTSWLLGKKKMLAGETAKDGSTPLMSVAGCSLPTNVVVAQQLLDAKASANSVSQAGRTALHEACLAKDDRCAQLLLKLGRAHLHALDAEGRTPLDIARLADMPKVMIARLRSLGGDEEVAGQEGGQRRGETAEDAAKREMRARKAEQSEASNWRTWREAHPRRVSEPANGYWSGNAVSAGTESPADSFSVNGDEILGGSARSYQDSHSQYQGTARSKVSLGDRPMWIGSADGVQTAKKAGRLTRLKNWVGMASSRSKSPQPAGGSGGILGTVQSENDLWRSADDPYT